MSAVSRIFELFIAKDVPADLDGRSSVSVPKFAKTPLPALQIKTSLVELMRVVETVRAPATSVPRPIVGPAPPSGKDIPDPLWSMMMFPLNAWTSFAVEIPKQSAPPPIPPVAEILNISTMTLRRWDKDGVLNISQWIATEKPIKFTIAALQVGDKVEIRASTKA